MNRPRPRFTIRRLMILVAIAALLMIPIIWMVDFNNQIGKLVYQDKKA